MCVYLLLCSVGMLLAIGNKEDHVREGSVLLETYRIQEASIISCRYLSKQLKMQTQSLNATEGRRPKFGSHLIRGESLRLGCVAQKEQAESEEAKQSVQKGVPRHGAACVPGHCLQRTQQKAALGKGGWEAICNSVSSFNGREQNPVGPEQRH